MFSNRVSTTARTATLLLTIFALLLTGCGKKQAEEIKIGAILPLTGAFAAYGEYMRMGIELALLDAESDGLVHPGQVKLIIEDSQAQPALAVNAYNKLVTIDKVVAIIPVTSGVILALKPLANRDGIVLMNASAISPEIEDSSDFCFSILPNAVIGGSFIANFVSSELSLNRAGILYRNDASGRGYLNSFSSDFTAKGGEVVYEQSYNPQDNDFRNQIAHLKEVNSLGILFAPLFGTEVAQLLKQMREVGDSTRVITYESFYADNVLQVGGDAVEGAIFCAPTFDVRSNAPEALAFVDRLKRAFNRTDANYTVVLHYDAMGLLLNGIREGAFSPASMRKFLSQKKVYNGLSGRIELDKNGGAKLPFSMYTVRNGRFTRYISSKLDGAK